MARQREEVIRLTLHSLRTCDLVCIALNDPCHVFGQAAWEWKLCRCWICEVKRLVMGSATGAAEWAGAA
jgi:hypothetical protein